MISQLYEFLEKKCLSTCVCLPRQHLVPQQHDRSHLVSVFVHLCSLTELEKPI